MIKSLLDATGLQEPGEQDVNTPLGKNLSTTDFCVVGLCRPPAGETVGPELNADQTIIPLLTLTQCHCFSPYLFHWVKSRWWGLRAEKAKESPHFKVTSLSSAVVSDPTHCFRSQKTHQSVFWSSVAKAAMQPKASLPEFLIHGPRVHLYGFYVHQCGWTQVLVLCFYFIIPQMII